MRRWDQFGSSAGSAGVPLSAGTWLELENGIQVQFTAGQYHAGESWVIPARTANGQIDWPPCESDGSHSQPGHRTEIFRAPLACIHWNSTGQTPVVEDCRRSFPPLTDLTSDVSSAIHVTQISWTNDDVMTLDQLIADGLTVTLDQAITGDVNGGNFIVTLETPAVTVLIHTQVAEEALSHFAVTRTPTIIDGPISTSTSPASIVWTMPGQLQNQINKALLGPAADGYFGRVRVKVMGHALFGTSGAGLIYLDGQSFGVPAVRSDGTTPRIDLPLPSGNGQKASDFESWFYLAPVLAVSSVSVQPPSLQLVPGPNNTWIVTNSDAGGTTGNSPTAVTQVGTVTLNYAAAADTTIKLSIDSLSTGASDYVSVPASIVIAKNQKTSKPFTVSVNADPGQGVAEYYVVASLELASGTSSVHSQQLSLAGIEAGF